MPAKVRIFGFCEHIGQQLESAEPTDVGVAKFSIVDEELRPPLRLWGSDLTNAIPSFHFKTLSSDSLQQFLMSDDPTYL